MTTQQTLEDLLAGIVADNSDLIPSPNAPMILELSALFRSRLDGIRKEVDELVCDSNISEEEYVILSKAIDQIFEKGKL